MTGRKGGRPERPAAPSPDGNHALAQVQLLQLVQVQGLQVQALVVSDMVCSSSEVMVAG